MSVEISQNSIRNPPQKASGFNVWMGKYAKSTAKKWSNGSQNSGLLKGDWISPFFKPECDQLQGYKCSKTKTLMERICSAPGGLSSTCLLPENWHLAPPPVLTLFYPQQKTRRERTRVDSGFCLGFTPGSRSPPQIRWMLTDSILGWKHLKPWKCLAINLWFIM